MPVPIMPVNDGSSSKKENFLMDCSFLSNLSLDMPLNTKTSSKFVQASNKDASKLYKLWQDGVRDKNQVFDINKTIENADLTARDISRLKSLGFVKGDMDRVSFTDRGKRLLVTITLSEPNRFQLKSESKPYNEILAEMSSKTRKTGSKITYADNNSNNLDLTK